MGNKLKVAMVTTYPEFEGQLNGGVQSVAYCLVNELKKNNSIELLIIARGGEKGFVEKRGGTTIYWLGSNGIIPDFIYYWTIERYKIHVLLKTLAPDIAHFQGVLGWLLNYRKPCVATIHGLGERDVLFSHRPFPRLRSWVIAKVENCARRMSKHNIIISPYVIEAIGNKLTGDVQNIENPVPSEFFEVERAVVKNRVLYVGRVSELKNVKGLIKTFAMVYKKNPQSELRLCGAAESNEFQTECIQLIKELGLEKSIKLQGPINRKELLDELKQAAILILLSNLEMAPMVIEEAMAVGVPVVASNIAGIPYLVEHGVTGYLVDQSDHVQAAKYINELLDNSDLNMRMGSAGKGCAIERFHVHRVVDKTLGYYQKVKSIKSY